MQNAFEDYGRRCCPPFSWTCRDNMHCKTTACHCF